MLEKDYKPAIIGIVEKMNWLVELSKAGCPDNLIKTALAIADYVHGGCKIGSCIRIPGTNCVDYGWAFPDQSRDVTAINGNNEATTSRKVNQLADQGWLVKFVEKRHGAKGKNMFALSFGQTWEVKSKKTAKHLEGMGGRTKTQVNTLVESNKRGLLTLTSADCSSQQAPVVDFNNVNINNKHILETETVNLNVKDYSNEVKENEDNTGAKAPQTISLISNEEYSLTPKEDVSLDDESITTALVELNNREYKTEPVLHAVVETDKRGYAQWELKEAGGTQDESNADAWTIIENRYPTFTLDRKVYMVNSIMGESVTSGLTIKEAAILLGHLKEANTETDSFDW
jgi:hypothetical protein